MFHVLEEESADMLWGEAVKWFGPSGISVPQQGRGGQTCEVLNASLTLTNPRQRWISSRSPAINPAFALAEVIWIMAGREDSAFVNYFNPKLPQFAGNGQTYHGAYGYRLRKQLGIDQLERAYAALSSNPESRQVVLQIWNSRTDLPNNDGSPQAPDIPCNIVAMLKLRNNRLEWTQVMRSNDFVLGLPHNIVQFSTLQEILAGWLHVEVGNYNHYADSLHLYREEISTLPEAAPHNPVLNSDSIAMPKLASDRSLKVLEEFCIALSTTSFSARTILETFEAIDLPPPFRNWGAILAADALRRRTAFPEMNRVLQSCSNSCLTTMFEFWLNRKG
jgi:thymidylate synthase